MNRKIVLMLILLAISTQTVLSQAVLKGRVIDKNSNERLVGAQIYFPELQKGCTTDENGNYLIKNLPIGRFSIQVSYIGFASQTIKIELVKGNQNKDFDLTPTIISLNPDVSITAIGYSSQHENAIKVESVQLKDLEQQASIGAMNKLSLIPGIDIIAKGPGIASPVIRGLSQTNILILNNGVRMENYQFSENHPFMISDEGISKVEIIKGPASLLYGSDAIGGVINFIKERPAPVGHIQADVNMAYQSNTRGIGTNVGVKGSSSRFSWGLRGNYQQHGDYLQATNGRVPNSRFQNKGLSLFAGSKQKYGTFFIYYDYYQGGLGITDPKIKNTDDYKLHSLYQNLDYHLLSSRNKMFLGNIKLEVNAAYQNNRRRLFGKDKYVVDMSLQAVNYDVKANISNTEKTSLIVGFQGNYVQSINADAPNEIIPNYFTNDFSIYGLGQYNILPKLNLQAGARFDYRHLFIPKYNDTTLPETININRNYQHISFTLGGTYSIGKHLLLRANLASAFRAPNVAELTQDGMHGNRYEKGNIDLEVQRSLEGDLGLHYHRNHWVFDASVYYNQIYNYIYLQYDTASANLGYDRYLYTQNDAAIYGLETGAEYSPWKYANLKAVYNFTIGKQTNGIYLPFIPQNKLRFEVKFHKHKVSFMHNAFISLGSTYAFAQNNPSQFETASPDYFLLNAGIGFDFFIGKQKLTIGVFGQNLLDAAYIDHLSTLKDLGYYDMGRNIAFKLRVPLDF
jgi:iron complex outermembrane receptor protein